MRPVPSSGGHRPYPSVKDHTERNGDVADLPPTGRHRMRSTLPGSLPDWPTVEAWLRRWWVSVASVALILGTATNVAVVITGRDPDRRTAGELVAAAPAVSAEAPGVAEPTPVPTSVAPTTPASLPSASRRPANPIDGLAAFAATVQQLVGSGDLDRKAGRELQRRVATIAESVQNGRSAGAAEKLRELDGRLAELRRDGKLSRAGFEALDVIDPIIAALG
jgi:hypothetical protein